MKTPEFGAAVPHHLDIPGKIRLSLFVCAPIFDSEFDQIAAHHKLLRLIADQDLEKRRRSRLVAAKTTGLLDFALVKCSTVIKPLETFLQYLNVSEQTVELLTNNKYMVEVTAVADLSDLGRDGSIIELLNLAACSLAGDTGAVVIEPYSLKILETPESIAALEKLGDGSVSLQPFLTVVQSNERGGVRTTTHGLIRLGLPDLEIKHVAEEQAPALAVFVAGLAQSLAEDVLAVKGSGQDQYYFDSNPQARPLCVTSEHIKRGNPDYQSHRNAGDPGCHSIAVKLKLNAGTKNGDLSIGLALHGRLAEKGEALQKILSPLNLT